MTTHKTSLFALAALLMTVPFSSSATAQLDQQLAGPTQLEPVGTQTIYETESIAQPAQTDPAYREYGYSSESATATSGQSGYSTMDDGRRVIYGADGTIYVEDRVGAGTYSSLGNDGAATTTTSTSSSTVEYEYTPSVSTTPQSVTQSSYPTRLETTPTDPATAPYADPYASEAASSNYGVQGQPAPGTATTSYPQQTQPRAAQSGNYLDWAKRQDGTRLSGTAKSIRRLIEDSSDTVTHFLSDENYEPLWRMSRDAKAIVIVPRLYRGGFVFGGSGGHAIMMARTETGSWSEPAFYTIGSASFGLQAGGDVSEVILLIMTERGKEQFLSSSFKIGGDVGIAAGPYGVGGKAQLTDVVAYTQAKGLYGGISLEGAVMKARYEWNDLYYGRDISTAEILIRNEAYNPNSETVKLSATSLQQRPLNNAPVEQR